MLPALGITTAALATDLRLGAQTGALRINLTWGQLRRTALLTD